MRLKHFIESTSLIPIEEVAIGRFTLAVFPYISIINIVNSLR